MAKNKKKVWEPEYRYEKLEGSFVDYRGNEREFTMVAVSIPFEEPAVVVENIGGYVVEPGEEVYDEETDSFEFTPDTVEWEDDYEVVDECPKMLSIGVAVKCAHDKFVEGLGERIAYGKAVTLRNHTLYVSDAGMINTEMVQALLRQEAKYFVQDPGHFIKGYNDDMKKFKETGRVADAEKTRSERENEKDEVISLAGPAHQNDLVNRLLNEAKEI